MKRTKVKLGRCAFAPQNPDAEAGHEVINIPDNESLADTLTALNQTVFVPGTGKVIDRAKCGAGRVYRL